MDYKYLNKLHVKAWILENPMINRHHTLMDYDTKLFISSNIYRENRNLLLKALSEDNKRHRQIKICHISILSSKISNDTANVYCKLIQRFLIEYLNDDIQNLIDIEIKEYDDENSKND